MKGSSRAPRDWAGMTTADFDAKAPLALPVPSGPARIAAAQHRTGTDALFGDEPAVAAAIRPPKLRRAPGTGQAELFDAAP